MNTPVRILEQIRAVIQLVNAGAQKPALRITTNVPDAPLPVTASKFGGVPYLPAGVDVPLGSDGQPLGMIAQINCAELPENTLYPESGMLQFWIAPRPGWGADPTAPSSPLNNRVIYYPELTDPNPHAQSAHIDWEADKFPEYVWPIRRGTPELALKFAPALHNPLQYLREPFDELFTQYWNERYPAQPIDGYEDAISLGRATGGDGVNIGEELGADDIINQLGGYPETFNDDPRQHPAFAKGYTFNLLTMGTEYELDPDVKWGYFGAANWLIAPEKLASRDFSDIYYEWDEHPAKLRWS